MRNKIYTQIDADGDKLDIVKGECGIFINITTAGNPKDPVTVYLPNGRVIDMLNVIRKAL